MKKIAVAIGFAMIFPFSGALAVFAPNELPKELSGGWRSVHRFASNNIATGKLSVTITEYSEDGTIKGAMSWDGSKWCVLKNEPMTGYFRDGELVIETTFRNIPGLNGGCGTEKFLLKKNSNGTFTGVMESTMKEESVRRITVELAPPKS